MVILMFILGLAFLIIGAEVLVRGASRLAALFGISPLVIGLTVVAFGTSSPEFAVTIKAAMTGQASLALGNVIGSNICNVLLILGVAAMIAPLTVAAQLIRFDVPLMIGLSALTVFFAWDGSFSRGEGIFFVLGLITYTSFLVVQSRKESAAVQVEYAEESGAVDSSSFGWLKNLAFVVGGLALLVLGSRWLVSSAVVMAQHFKVSEAVIGLTVVAVGTSLPEIVTSVVASLRGKVDIAVGNVVGSNIFNLMGVLGLAGIIAPDGVAISSGILGFDLPVMLLTTFACLPIFFTGSRISRLEGALFFGYYCAYTLHLILTAAEHELLPGFSMAMLYFALPLTAVTLFTVAAREWRKKK
ncbi:calcium/sodium antiporter [Candidatus Electronema sp. JC]|uniref:calcium/sodium antiporter n=1 Tax=Candidatus Electronema sp. JC TaxID=3401570 RepID=UPI003B4303C7